MAIRRGSDEAHIPANGSWFEWTDYEAEQERIEERMSRYPPIRRVPTEGSESCPLDPKDAPSFP